MIRVRADVAQVLLNFAKAYGKDRHYPPSEMAAALVLAGVTIMSSGMNEEQVRALLEQTMTMTESLREETLKRWKREGFDPFKGPPG